MEDLATRLHAAHLGYDNYYSEPPLMAEINGYCQKSSDIPAPTLPRLVQVIVQCRLGRGLSYHDGVSPGAKPMYDSFLGILDEKGIAWALQALGSPELSSKLDNPIRQQHLVAILSTLESVVVPDRLREAVQFLKADVTKVRRQLESREFRELMAPFAQN